MSWKKKKMVRSIIIDSREPEWVQNLNFYGAKKTVMEMEYGDIWATCDDGQTLVIERKEPEDFVGSMVSNRLMKQAFGLSRLREGGLWPYVMITGDLMSGPNGKTYVNGKIRDVKFSSIQGLLLSIQELGVYVVYANDSRDLEQAVVRLSNRNRSEEMIIPPAKRHGAQLGASADFLSGLPGIGTSFADAILKNTGTAANALEMLTGKEPIPNVQIGHKRRESIRRMLGLKENETLKVIKK